jgi:iron complex transport system ATP-binding protein
VSVAGLLLERVTVGYRRRGTRPARTVLTDVTLTAPPGVVTVLLGPNGAGKSTLLRSVAGLQPVQGGSIRLDGLDLVATAPRDRARAVAVVLTDRFDPGLLRGEDVVALGRYPHLPVTGTLRDSDRAAVSDALAAVHAEPLAPRPLAELSDGERQRIMIARALAQDPGLLVLDEPSAFLDAPARLELLAVLDRIATARRIPVVVSTHDVETALRGAAHGWVIDGSRVVAGELGTLAGDGTIGEAFDTAAVRFDPADGIFKLR